MDFKFAGGNKGAQFSCVQHEKNGILFADLLVTFPEEAVPETFSVTFHMDILDIYSTWSPSLDAERNLSPFWRPKETNARLVSWMPSRQLISVGGKTARALRFPMLLIPRESAPACVRTER